MDAPKILTPKQRVLVVEDDCRMLELLCNGLREAEHSPMAASNGGEAIELAMNFSFDSIILDIGLPIRDGYVVAHCMYDAQLNGTPIQIRICGNFVGHGRPRWSKLFKTPFPGMRPLAGK